MRRFLFFSILFFVVASHQSIYVCSIYLSCFVVLCSLALALVLLDHRHFYTQPILLIKKGACRLCVWSIRKKLRNAYRRAVL